MHAHTSKRLQGGFAVLAALAAGLTAKAQITGASLAPVEGSFNVELYYGSVFGAGPSSGNMTLGATAASWSGPIGSSAVAYTGSYEYVGTGGGPSVASSATASQSGGMVIDALASFTYQFAVIDLSNPTDTSAVTVNLTASGGGTDSGNDGNYDADLQLAQLESGAFNYYDFTTGTFTGNNYTNTDDDLYASSYAGTTPSFSDSNLSITVSTNTIYNIQIEASSSANYSSGASGSSAYLDPLITLTPGESNYGLLFSPGINPPSSAPDAHPTWIALLGALMFLARLHRRMGGRLSQTGAA